MSNMDRTELLRTVYDALGRDDLEAMRKHVAEDVEIVERLEVPGARVYNGIDDWERGYAEESETISDFAVDLLAVEEIGGRCVADVVIRMVGKGSGAEVEERLAHLVDFDGDKFSRWRAFSELEDARRTAREECVRELYDLWSEGDLDGALARVHPDIYWAEPEETIGSQSRRGASAAREGLIQWQGSFDSFGGELTGVESVESSVIAAFTQRVRAGGSSVEIENVVFHVWGFSEGLPGRMEMFFERDQAVQAAKS